MVKINRLMLLGAFILSLFGCGGTNHGASDSVQFSANFESGSLPLVTQQDTQGLAFELALKDDNNDSSLPNSFRTWWYFKMDQVPVQQKMHLEFSRLGFSYFFVPVYSYDGINWQYFDEADVALVPGCDVSIPETCRLVVNRQFSASTVWLARTFPYTTQDLSRFLSTISASRCNGGQSVFADPCKRCQH